MRRLAFAVLLALCAMTPLVRAQTTNFIVNNVDMSAYEINGDFNPPLTLRRGKTYTFTVNAGAVHPFYIKTVQGAGTGNQYNNGVTNQGAHNGGILTFAVPLDAPQTLWYQCSNHGIMSNTITTLAALPTATVPALRGPWLALLAFALTLVARDLYRRRARA